MVLSNVLDYQACRWDVVVIGTGMGGATIGHALAKQGKRVLFCERGKALRDGHTHQGEFAESFFPTPDIARPEYRETLLNSGRYAEQISDVTTQRARHFVPFIGTGTGGSSAIYGAALERFFPADFVPRQFHADPESSLPEQWPITYEELVPFYEAAERLYGVRGTGDPLRLDVRADHFQSPPPLHPATADLFDWLDGKGLHPYRLPQGCEFVPGCTGCQGFLCRNNCKNDSVRVCLQPALDHHGAQLLDDCEVLRLESTPDAVTGLCCRHQGRGLTLRADVVVLAAGALETPRLLLNSANQYWPDGLANGSGLVGRNLMRHYVDLYAILPKTRESGHPGNLKELAINDFYLGDGNKFGAVQSFGLLPPADVIVAGMEKDAREGPIPWLSVLIQVGKPILRRFLASLLGSRIVLASIMEDLPYSENRVTVPGDATKERVELHYQIRESERRRIKTFRRKLRGAFSGRKYTLIKQAENSERIAHACGTCRFGVDPNESVLNRWNQAHGLSNLYVVDASFFPSSGGTNPALTIAANALRVASFLQQGSAAQQNARTTPKATSTNA